MAVRARRAPRAVRPLFVDEAGQFALADAAAVGARGQRASCCSATRSSSRRSPRPTHPDGSGASVLEHLLDGASTIPPGRGVLLTETWRMHPDVCAFVSERSYDGRLHRAPRCAQRTHRRRRGALTGAGLRSLAVEHQGRSQASPEEADAIAAACRDLLAGAHRHRRPRRRRAGLARATTSSSSRRTTSPCALHPRARARTASRVGTVDRFQGQEAPVVFYAMTCSSRRGRAARRRLPLRRRTGSTSRSPAPSASPSSSHSPRLLDADCRTLDAMAAGRRRLPLRRARDVKAPAMDPVLRSLLTDRLRAATDLGADAAQLVLYARDGPEEVVAAPARAGPSGCGSVTVEGFRGIGPAATLTLEPQPGLTVVVGRNGSGKSSFAEGLELLMTGGLKRLEKRTKAWTETWQCLHHAERTRIGAELVIGGSGGVVALEQDWARGAAYDDVSGRGAAAATLAAHGWDRGLGSFRPFLSYAELASMFDTLTSLYDALSPVLGLADIDEVARRLGETRLELDNRRKATVALRDEVLARLDPDDARAALVSAAISARKPDLDAIAELLRDTPAYAPDQTGIPLLRRLAGLAVPTDEEVGSAFAGLADARRAPPARPARTPSGPRRSPGLLRQRARATRLRAPRGRLPGVRVDGRARRGVGRGTRARRRSSAAGPSASEPARAPPSQEAATGAWRALIGSPGLQRRARGGLERTSTSTPGAMTPRAGSPRRTMVAKSRSAPGRDPRQPTTRSGG